MTFIWISLLLGLLCLPQESSYALTTMKTSTTINNQDAPDSSIAYLDFHTSATENSLVRAYPFHNPGDLNEETTAVDSTHVSSDHMSGETVTMIPKKPAGDISTWKSVIEFEETEVSTRENITTTDNQGTTKLIDLVEDATASTNESPEPATANQGAPNLIDLVKDTTATVNESSEPTTKKQAATKLIDVFEDTTATANGPTELTTGNQGTTKLIDLVEDTTASANGSTEPTTGSQGTTKLIDLVEDASTSATGSTDLTTISSNQSLFTSSAFNFSHMQEVNPDTTSETAMTHRTESSTEKKTTHYIAGQCFIAIFILALIASFFIICTIAIFIKLTVTVKKFRLHQQYSTEMTCISSLISDREPVAERSKVKPKRMKSFGGNADDSDEDNTTLNSFLPDH